MIISKQAATKTPLESVDTKDDTTDDKMTDKTPSIKLTAFGTPVDKFLTSSFIIRRHLGTTPPEGLWVRVQFIVAVHSHALYLVGGASFFRSLFMPHRSVHLR